jgi:two-component system sensor histidine kinase KdpD
MLLVFLLAAGVVSALVSTATRRTREAARAQAEAETLAALSGTVAASDDPLPELVDQLRGVFGADAVAVLRRGPGTNEWEVEAASGHPVPARPDEGVLSLALRPGEELVVTGRNITSEDLMILRAFAGEVAAATERRRLRATAAAVDDLERANELRTALLAAVSHDLRTPLATIKASVTSLVQPDVRWSPEAQREFLETIDTETDRLNSLVGNLLDMSRIQAGALDLVLRDVGLDEVVPAAMGGLAGLGRLDVDVPETLPRVRVDPALLERAIANVIANALQWSADDQPVRVEAGTVGDRVHLRIVDRGPGVHPSLRTQMFQPFQRFGDGRNASGVGLGLAVARGFVEVMGGELTVDDTPGGGLTMVVDLPMAAA